MELECWDVSVIWVIIKTWSRSNGSNNKIEQHNWSADFSKCSPTQLCEGCQNCVLSDQQKYSFYVYLDRALWNVILYSLWVISWWGASAVPWAWWLQRAGRELCTAQPSQRNEETVVKIRGWRAVCDNYHWSFSLGLMAAGKFCQYNKSSPGRASFFSQKKSAEVITTAQAKWSLKINCTQLSILPIPVVVLIHKQPRCCWFEIEEPSIFLETDCAV